VLFIFIGVFMIPSWWLIGLFVVLDLIAHVITPDNGIANMAHLGGYGFGIATGFFLLGTGILKREPYDLLSILKHRQRRRAFASAHRVHTQGMDRVMRDARAAAPDPRVQHLANARAQIGTLLSDGQADEAADAYLRLIDEFGHNDTAPLTLHRDAQYQIANTLYQRGDRVQAADAFLRLLGSYPADPERHMIGVLIARTRAEDQGDVPGAITILEEIGEQSLNNETRAIVKSELERIRETTKHTEEDTTT
jgi:tetratricopeptide (TPR) repeat protein